MAEQLPIWQDPGVEPPALLKTNGWQPGMKPSAQHMNWLFNRIYKCIEEIQAGGGTEELEQELVEFQVAFAEHITAKATVNEVGHVQLSNLINGSSETKAATELAVKNAVTSVTQRFEGYAVTNDANSITDTSVHALAGGGLNGPPIADGWTTIFTAMPLADRGMQIAQKWNDSTESYWIRRQNNGIWGSWSQLITSNRINVPNGVIGLDANGNAPGNLTGKRVKLGEVNYAITPGLIVEFVIPPGYKKVIMEGEVDFDTLTQGQLYMQFNDLATNNTYQVARLSTSITTSNYAQISIFQSINRSGLYIEIDADSPFLFTRSYSAYNLSVAQLTDLFTVDRLQKIKLIGQNGSGNIITSGIVTVWGEPI
ncbi:pyocin knob domain-containing protein [Psychrobacillus psychrotolerans]|uniref:phage tail protein n=2 Tax=Psychrobacillus psychrotolerans TaxID=126156 RepID=UPI003C791F47